MVSIYQQIEEQKKKSGNKAGNERQAQQKKDAQVERGSLYMGDTPGMVGGAQQYDPKTIEANKPKGEWVETSGGPQFSTSTYSPVQQALDYKTKKESRVDESGLGDKRNVSGGASYGSNSTGYADMSPSEQEAYDRKLKEETMWTVDNAEEYVPTDPENDPSLFEPALFSDAAYDYWNTAEPAEPEERSLFESPSFQQSALTFGLTLMMGGSFQDAMYNGGEAFARTEYKNTEEYQKMYNMGIPSYVIEDAYISGDSKELNSWYNSTVTAEKNRKEWLDKLNNPSLSDEQKKAYGSMLGIFDKEQVKLGQYQMGTQMYQDMKSRMDAGKSMTATDGLSVVYQFIKTIDPNSAVKEGEVHMIAMRMGWGTTLIDKVNRALETGGNEPMPPEVVAEIMESMKQQSTTGIKTSLTVMNNLNAQADINQLGASARTWNAYINNYTTANPQFQSMFYK